MKNEIIINKLPTPTWRWLQGNEVKLAWGQEVPFTINQEENITTIFSGDGEFSTGEVIYTAQNGDTQTIVQFISSNYQDKSSLQLHTHLDVQENSKIKLIQVFAFNKNHTVVSKVTADCKDNATAELIQFMAGKGDIYCDTLIGLNGKESKYNMGVGYMTQEQTLDMNLLVQHKGIDTLSEIQLEGVIKEKGYKTFRGTIDLQHGGSGAIGAEHENVMLLGDDFKNLTIPVILCGQEDVKGSHGGSIGELDEEILFYLNTRGIDKETAEALIVNAKFESIMNTIDDKEIIEIVHQALKEALGYEQ